MKIQKVNKLLLENMLAVDANIYKKIKNIKGNKVLKKTRKNKIIKNKNKMFTNKININKINTNKTCEDNSQNNQKSIIEENCSSISKPYSKNSCSSSSTIIPDFDNEQKFHYRSKSVTFVEDSLEQIRLFNTFDPPNSINMTPTHYSTGKINSHSLLKYHRRYRNDEFKLLPFSPSELKENALYDHPVRSHRRYSKFNMPYNLKMDFSFGDPISTTPITTPKLESTPLTLENNNINNDKSESNECNKEVSITSNPDVTKHSKSPIQLNNYTYTSNNIESIKKPINFVNERNVIYDNKLLSVTTNKIPQLV